MGEIFDFFSFFVFFLFFLFFCVFSFFFCFLHNVYLFCKCFVFLNCFFFISSAGPPSAERPSAGPPKISLFFSPLPKRSTISSTDRYPKICDRNFSEVGCRTSRCKCCKSKDCHHYAVHCGHWAGNESENAGPMWNAPHDRLRHFLLEKYARALRCPTCESALSVGFDCKESTSVPLCGHPVGASTDVQELGWSLQFGCEQTCAGGSAFCSEHQPANLTGSIQVAPLQCPEGHDLVCMTIPEGRRSEHACDICGTSISEDGGRRKSNRGVKLWHCSAGCRYDVCDPCFVGMPPPTSSRHG